MSSNRVSGKWIDYLIGWGIVIAFLLPHTSVGFLVINPILCILYKVTNGKKEGYKQNLYVVATLLVTFILGVSQQDIAVKSVLMVLTMILYYSCFPIVKVAKIPNKYFHICLVVINISQLAYVLQIPFAMDVLDVLYPIPINDVTGIAYAQANATISDVFEYRMGGLYRNANLCSMSLTLLLAMYIVQNYERSFRKNSLFICICCFAILLTGSRTGFVVMIAIVLSYFFPKKGTYGYMSITSMAIILIGVGSVFLTGSDTFRSFNVSSGLNDSASMKFETFLYYITNEDSVLRVLFGYMDAGKFQSPSAYMNYFDSDYGNMIFCYGVVGFVTICVYFYSLFRKMDIKGKLFFINMLWMVSAAIISSYRHLFIFMLLLSILYQSHKTKTTKEHKYS